MLTPLIAGNWKMHTTVAEGVALVMKLRELTKAAKHVEIVIAPPFTSLYHLHFLTKESSFKLSGQDMHWEKSGAFTGEVSAEMLKDVGCEYVILGHSERRQFFGDTDDIVKKKLLAALKMNLKPIVCVGETLDERETGKTMDVVSRQIKSALMGLGPGVIKELTFAYEPVWAIGTGKTATPGQAEEIHNSIRSIIYETGGPASGKAVRIIYGGSVKPDNIDSLMAEPNIDGALVGGASLKADDFARIVNFKKSV
ncbi:MAG: triose-phosphate isomerase [Deltaproteobacteria bacterium]|nr:triose-phosphate isomerase [Deltaproteobacteria bacterium]